MKRWEYMTVDKKQAGSNANFEALIAVRGTEGWELVTIVFKHGVGMLGEWSNEVAWFKREVPDGP